MDWKKNFVNNPLGLIPPLKVINPTTPKIGDKVGYIGRSYPVGIVSRFDGSIIEVQWGDSVKEKFDINYFIYYFYVVTDPNSALKELL